MFDQGVAGLIRDWSWQYFRVLDLSQPLLTLVKAGLLSSHDSKGSGLLAGLGEFKTRLTTRRRSETIAQVVGLR